MDVKRYNQPYRGIGTEIPLSCLNVFAATLRCRRALYISELLRHYSDQAWPIRQSHTHIVMAVLFTPGLRTSCALALNHSRRKVHVLLDCLRDSFIVKHPRGLVRHILPMYHLMPRVPNSGCRPQTCTPKQRSAPFLGLELAGRQC